MSAELRRSSYACKGCGAILRPKPRDCCVYCSHSSVPCPSFQARLWRLMLELFTYDDSDSSDSDHLVSDITADEQNLGRRLDQGRPCAPLPGCPK